MAFEDMVCVCYPLRVLRKKKKKHEEVHWLSLGSSRQVPSA